MFLEHLAATLEGDRSGEHRRDSSRMGTDHGAQRARQNVPIDSVIGEYGLLRQTILEELEEDGAPLPHSVRLRLHEALDLGLQNAIAEYARCTRQELETANQRLAEEDRHKDRFLSMLAHEMRSPLGAVLNAASLLETCPLDERGIRQVSTIRRQADHLTRLVEDLLDLSRVAQGKIDLRCAPVSCEVFIREAVESVRPAVEERDQRLICSLTAEPLVVKGDSTRLRQIVVNLLGNAAKFSEPGRRIWVVLERDGGEACIRVKDEGIGIDPISLPTLFGLFEQKEGPGGARGGGLGIGLYLVKCLAEMHGGAVTAHSAGEGEGTEFTVRLPLLSP